MVQTTQTRTRIKNEPLGGREHCAQLLARTQLVLLCTGMKYVKNAVIILGGNGDSETLVTREI